MNNIRSETPLHDDTNRRNILIVGDAGVGKSALINLIADEELAVTSSCAKLGTPHFQEYTVTLDNIEFALYDTPGMHQAKSYMKTSQYMDPECQVYSLISKLERSGGISLLVFCMKGGRISITSRQAYSLIVDAFLNRPVPIVIVVTDLEMYDPMEKWWNENEEHMKEYGFKPDAHACITATRGYKNAFDGQYEESRRIIRKLLLEYSGRREEKAGWAKWPFTALSLQYPKRLKHKDLKRKLTKRCGFSPEEVDLIIKHIETVQNLPNDSDEQTPSKDWHEKVIQDRRDQPAVDQVAPTQRAEKDVPEDSIRSIQVQDAHLNEKISDLEDTVHVLREQLRASQLAADEKDQIIRAHHTKHWCEVMYARGSIYNAAELLLEIVNTSCEGLKADGIIAVWLEEFVQRCITALESAGTEASDAKKYDDAVRAYSTALSLAPSASRSVLIKWARTILVHASAREALRSTVKFKLPRFHLYRAICEVLEEKGRVMDAISCLRHMEDDLSEDTDDRFERAQWVLDFRRRSVEKLRILGNDAMDSKNYYEALGCYSFAISLDRTSDLVIKCCKAWEGMLGEALANASEVIKRSPSSYEGYKRKYTILHCMGRHREAFEAFQVMLSMLKKSPNPRIRELCDRYVDVTPTIRHIVQQTIRDMPRVLINTATGHLLDKTQQAAFFEQLPIFHELRSSMTTRIDEARIQREVQHLYRYVMLSHRWEDGEPLFQALQAISIYNLGSSSANVKLKTFCTIMRALGFQWVWSDTCCIDKRDNVVLQESLVAMFTWYRDSSLTAIYLRGVWSETQEPGDLRRNVWNTRAWTYQEYVAAKTVRIYTEDWKPYLGLTIHNHKDSPAVISEMQQSVEAQALAVIRPGLEGVREKLHVASMRCTTLTEDIAYSLLGIFNAAIPVIYGEGNRAVGRLLEHVLTGSGDATILSWTGHAGNYNSCLPLDLTVYHQLVPPHIPPPIGVAEMNKKVATFRSSLSTLDLATALYTRLNELPSPAMHPSWLRLPSLVFSISEFIHRPQTKSKSDIPGSGMHVYCATTAMLGDVEIQTTDNLSDMQDLLLVHPWISPLLDQDASRRPGALGRVDPLRALRLAVRLRQPFGALLLAPLSRVQYKRVATDSLIMVRIPEETSLSEMIDGICTVDIQ